jgi:hypothetical protein
MGLGGQIQREVGDKRVPRVEITTVKPITTGGGGGVWVTILFRNIEMPLLLWPLPNVFSPFWKHILLIYFVQAGLHALSIIAMIFGPRSREWLAIVSHLVLLASIFNVVQGFPVEFNQTIASVYVERRNSEPSTDTWTDPGGAYTGFRLHSSCVNHQDFFRSVLDNMHTVVSPLWGLSLCSCQLLARVNC